MKDLGVLWDLKTTAIQINSLRSLSFSCKLIQNEKGKEKKRKALVLADI